MPSSSANTVTMTSRIPLPKNRLVSQEDSPRATAGHHHEQQQQQQQQQHQPQPQPPVSRIPKAISQSPSPERFISNAHHSPGGEDPSVLKRLGKENLVQDFPNPNQGGGSWKKSRIVTSTEHLPHSQHQHQQQQHPSPSSQQQFDSATFVRRLSPPAAGSKANRNDGPALAALTSPTKHSQPYFQQHVGDSVEVVDLEDQLNAKVTESRNSHSGRRRDSQGSTNGSSSPRKTSAPSPSRIPISSDYVMGKSRANSLTGDSGSGSLIRQPSPPRKFSPPSASKTSPPPKTVSTSDLSSSHSMMSPSKSRDNGLHLDLVGSRIPLPKSSSSSGPMGSPCHTGPRLRTSPPRAMPTLGWSFSPERMLTGDQHHNRTSLSTSNLPSGHSSGVRAPAASSSSAEGNSTGNGSVATEHPQKRKKNFEAFVMTGDRMICLAKTPANQEFKSKHHQRQQEDSASDSAPSLPLAEQEEDEVEVGEREEVVRRAPPAAKRALVRNSKSEDQLNVDAQLSPPDDYSGSVNTLLDTSGIGILPLDDSATSSAASPSRHFHQPEEPRHPTKIQQSSPPQSTTKESASHQMLLSQTKRGHPSPPKGQRPFDPTSPEELIDTSSLMSCSEHYNAESVLDNKISPNSSSSPDTPEWSLLDSIHKKNGQAVGGGLATIDSMEDSFTNESLNNGNNNGALTNNNKTIISIGDHQQQQQLQQHKQQNIMLLQDDILEPPEEVVKHVVTSPGSGSLSSNRTITPEQDFKELLRETTANQQQVVPMQTSSSIQNSIMSNSSEEDSDLDSLHSYHPPVKVIDVPSAVRLAKRLYYLHGFKKTDVSRQLSKNTEYNSVVAEEYLKFFDFESCSLDAALRQFLSHFVLTGETQERERVLLYFSKRYLECNPSVHGTLFNSPDAVHTLTCAIMLLNTDLHGTSIPRKMTGNEFIENLSDLNEGKDFPKDLLRSVYNAIKEKAIPWAAAEDSANLTPVTHSGTNSNEAMGGSQLQPQQQQQQQHNHPASAISIGQGAAGGINPFLSLPDPDQAIDYKNGYVMRKSCFDASGKKTKLGKRSWKMFFLTLRDMVLYCFKDEKTVRTPGAFEDLNSAIRIHHGLAVRAMDYTKKQFVFRLYTADQAQFLFQTSDEKELLTWIDTINYVVASFSSPQLPAPCSSGGRFQRPLLPSSKTRLEPSEQLQSHENQLVQLRDEMEDHLQNPPGKGTRAGAKQSVLLAYKEKTDHLTFEILRYETYVLTLRTKSGHE